MPGSRLASGRPRLAAAPGCAGCLLRPGVRAWGVVRVQRGWPCLLPARCVCRLPALTCADTLPSLPQGVYPRPLTSTGM